MNEGRDSINIFDSEDKHSIHIRIRDVLLATTAAPTYFKAVINNEAVRDYDYVAGKPYAFADGGLGANRPAAIVLQVLKEGHTYHEQADILENTMICSINFGVDDKTKAQIPSANFDGVLGWLLKGLVDILMKNDEEGDATEVRLDLTGEGQNTEIVLPITKECKNLDDSSPENISRLKVIGERYLENNLELVQKLCDRLIADYQDNLEEFEDLNSDLNTNSNAMVDDKVDDERHESGPKNSYIVKATIESNAPMINTELELTSTTSDVNKTVGVTETKSITPSQEKEIAKLQEGVRCMVSDVANRAEYLKYLEALRLDDTDLVSEVSQIVQEESLPKEVQETIQWLVSNAKRCPNVLEAIKSVISNSDKSISVDILWNANTCGTSAKEESTPLAGQDNLYEQVD